MPQKRHTVDQIVSKLRKADVELGKSKKVPEVCKVLETTDNQILACIQVASVLSPLHHFLRLSVRHSCSDFVQSHSIKDVGSNLFRTTGKRPR